MTDREAILPWHVPYWQLLHQYLLQNRPPQALLLSGVSGLGKHRLAKQFAQALLCEHRNQNSTACNVCHSCILFAAETHPDFIILVPEEPGKAIGVDAIRGLLPKLSLKPQFLGYRVVMIASAEWLNHAAANAFLKCLEEPSERTIILLVCAQLNRLPATIRSRCQQLKLTLPSNEIALDWLASQNQTAQARLLLHMAQGAPLLANQYAHESCDAIWTECFKQWIAVAQQQRSPIAIAEQWQKLPLAPLLAWMLTWVSELIKAQFNMVATNVEQPVLPAVLQEVQKRLDLKRLFALYDNVLVAQQHINTQLNKQLLIEGILIQWLSMNCRE